MIHCTVVYLSSIRHNARILKRIDLFV